jgi:CP family cyanate transporter-like MFS transporter
MLAAASAWAAGRRRDVPVLLAARAGRLWLPARGSLPAPSLLRQLVPPGRVNLVLGVWGAYMPLGHRAGAAAGPWVMAALGWRAWWWGLAGVSLAMALLAFRRGGGGPAGAARRRAGGARPAGPGLAASPAPDAGFAPGPWLVALTFAMYSPASGWR